MKTLNIFTKLFVPILFFCFSSCGTEPVNDVPKERKAIGDVNYGGVLKINKDEYFATLFPHHVDEIIAQQIASQVYEGLVKLSPKSLEVLPSLAKDWEIRNGGRTFKFQLRTGIYFRNDPCFKDGIGREVKAADFKYCFEKLCTSNDQMNSGFYIFQDRVIGANEYYESTLKGKPLKEGVRGIKVLNDSTLQIDLEYPYHGFINMLTMPFTWVFPREAFENYGVDMRTHCVGTGPFYIKDSKNDESVILARNENYWSKDAFGNQLPYLDIVKFSFNKEKTAEYLEFRKGNLDLVSGIPSELRKKILQEVEIANSKFSIQIIPIMAIEYYGFQTQGKLFQNKKLRQAFNYAIDREKIAKFVLQDEAQPAIYGIVPPSFPNYNAKAVKGFSYNPGLARKLLAEAGYPSGNGFPKDFSLVLNSGGERNIEVAQAIQKMLADNLNLPIKLNVLPFPQKLEQENKGTAQFWKAGWVADYLDPQSFLDLFYGKLVPDEGGLSPVNSGRYKSSRFDSLYEMALKQVNPVKRYALYQQADQAIIDDAAYMPIYYDQNTYLTQNYVKNLDFNALDYLDFSQVYFKKEKPPAAVKK
jgi:peptide/nickel transport system substrate-binding protein